MGEVIYPGAAVGVLGSGQLGRMFAIAARRMGYRVHTYSPDTDTPTGQVADLEVVGAYEDLEKVREFARGVKAVTFEFENVPFATAEAVAEVVRVRPGGKVLHTTQHRLREKTFLREAGFPVAGFERVSSQAELEGALGRLGVPAILKSAGWGYDGKGQVRISSAGEAGRAWGTMAGFLGGGGGGGEAVLEAFVPFEREASVVFARGKDGSFVHWGMTENVHVGGILDLSVSPARLPEKVRHEGVQMAHAVAEAIEVVGVMCVEFFVVRGGGLVINELAPRPHNSGHWTFDFSVTSQFEQQLRAVCGLPLGGTEMVLPGGGGSGGGGAGGAVAMAQLLGDLWSPPVGAGGELNYAAALADPRVKLHLYGKMEARAGRKMGHLTAWGRDGEEAMRVVREGRERLVGR